MITQNKRKVSYLSLYCKILFHRVFFKSKHIYRSRVCSFLAHLTTSSQLRNLFYDVSEFSLPERQNKFVVILSVANQKVNHYRASFCHYTWLLLKVAYVIHIVLYIYHLFAIHRTLQYPTPWNIDSKGSGFGLIWGIIQAFAWTNWQNMKNSIQCSQPQVKGLNARLQNLKRLLVIIRHWRWRCSHVGLASCLFVNN
jgi:hypothetical protein